MLRSLGRVLAIAGSDSGGGAGIQADIKTITALGGYAATAITAITVQNTLGVVDIFPLPAALVAAQARAVLEDIGADAIKTGMFASAETVEAVADLLDDWPAIPLVVDPVLLAKGGASLTGEAAARTLRQRLIPRARLVTPNAPEAQALTGVPVQSVESARRAAQAILGWGAQAVLIKGGHIEGEEIVDLLVTRDEERRFAHRRIVTRHTHGTGCTLASACAVAIGMGLDLNVAVERGIAFVQQAIRHAPGLGDGAGPLDHGWALRAASEVERGS